MKKIILALSMVLLSTSLFAETSVDVFSKEGSVYVPVEGADVFIYDRKTLSIKHQDIGKLQRNLQNGVCKSPKLSKNVNAGRSAFFIYTYKDGTLSASVTKCY